MTKFVLILCGFLFSVAAQAEDYKSAFDRVMATNTIRCGYIVAPPLLAKDPNTGVLSGVSYDLVERIGKDLSLKIEWVEEAGFGTWQEGLATGRYDMLCTTMWATSPRARVAAFSAPVFYTAINAYARTDDHRFDDNLKAANDPAVTVATLDGSTSALIAADDFPQAKRDSLANLTDSSQLLMDVQISKADLTFEEAAKFFLFERANPGKLRNVTPDHPVRLVTNSFFVRGDEVQLLGMINATVGNLHNSGYINKLLNSYEPTPGIWRRVAQPFQ